MHMNGFEKGIYALPIGNYFVNTGPLPDDDQRLALMTSPTIEQWGTVGPAIERYFKVYDGLWHHARIDRNIAEEEAEHKGKSEGAQKANAKRHSKRPESGQKANTKRPQLQLHSHSQLESVPEGTERVKAVTNGVENALELPDEEELRRRTRDLVGKEEMKPKGGVLARPDYLSAPRQSQVVEK